MVFVAFLDGLQRVEIPYMSERLTGWLLHPAAGPAGVTSLAQSSLAGVSSYRDERIGVAPERKRIRTDYFLYPFLLLTTLGQPGMAPMREFEDQPSCDGGDAGTDSPNGYDRSSQQRGEVVRDAAARMASALEYRQRVEAVYSAYAARESVSRDADSSPRLSRSESAERMSREVELPVDVQERPEARDVLPNLRLAEVDPRKFSEYSLNPGHPHNGGKAEGWRALGYDVDSPQARSESAEDIREQIRDGLLACGRVTETRDTPFGPTYKVLNGFIGPNGRHATLVTCWLVESKPDRGFPKLTTAWVQPHRDKEPSR